MRSRSDRIWKILATLAIGLLCASGAASEQTNVAENYCFNPSNPSSSMIIIDANNGDVLHGSLERKRREEVEVIITRKNPFRYSYKTSINLQEQDSSGVITQFLSFVAIPLPDAPAAPSEGEDTPPASPGRSGESSQDDSQTKAPPPCSTGPEAELLARWEGKLGGLKIKARQIRGELVTLQSEATRLAATYDNFLRQAKREPFTYGVCSQVVGRFDKVRNELGAFKVGDLPARAKRNAAEAKALEALIDAYAPSAECRSRYAALRLEALEVQSTTEKLQTAAEALAVVEDRFDKLVADINVLTPVDFHERRWVRGKGGHSIAEIEVERKPLQPADAKSEKVAEEEVEFGWPLFTLTAGFGVSWIEERTFGQEDSLVPGEPDDGGMDGMQGMMDGMDEMVVGKRFAVTKETEPTILGTVLLNGNLWRKRFECEEKMREEGRCKDWRNGFGVALSMGATIADNEEASDYGFLFGPSLSLLDDKLYLTLAYHHREIAVLGGGFEDGDPVPDGIGETPIRTRNDEGVILTVTYAFN